MLYHGRPAPPWDPEETESEEELAAKQLMDIHAADKELGVASWERQSKASTKADRASCCDRAGEDEVGEGGEET